MRQRPFGLDSRQRCFGLDSNWLLVNVTLCYLQDIKLLAAAPTMEEMMNIHIALVRVGVALSVAMLASCTDSKPIVLPDTHVTRDRQIVEQRLDQPTVDVRRVDLPTKLDHPKGDLPAKVDVSTKVDLPAKGDLPKVDKAKDVIAPKDATHLSLSVAEQWYQGSTTCGSAQLIAKSYYGTIQVQLLQIPAAQVQGTCSGHKAEISISSAVIQIGITGNTSSACWTACWDFTFTIAPIAPGTYQINYLNLSTSVQVYSYSG
jgi:hypothetical protein